MSVAAHAHSTYGLNTRTLKTPRDIEYDVLARVTGRLQAQLPHPKGRTSPQLVAALNDNRRLWTAFATDLAGEGNAFPNDLKARLFYLAEFTLRHTTQVLAGTATADVLAEINTAVMRGLRGQGVTP
ncbi:flagellar biosynthesis regulator FlaF [Pararhodobacter sp.]|uniref:flagellar biosynthesis regulator FlaF n=1 Tax=Pararhodobacter sp. TaxID=2127056 RepID=UPI002AFFF1D1|nr:flagellar biosynthesis regulator FlaF [Pararhodobacter sp.]